jgi:hypothetical protein
MSRILTDFIAETECIGDSLVTINDNFENLDTSIQSLSSTFTAGYACERDGVGGLDQLLAYGDGASTHLGLLMPYAGQVIAATLQGTSIVGTVVVDAFLNGIKLSPIYRLSYTGTTTTGGDIKTFNIPINFNAGDTFGWIQSGVPSGGSFNVNYLVRYFL